MPQSRIKALLQEAKQALHGGEDVSPEDLALLRQLETDIEERLQAGSNEDDSALETLTRAEAAFAARHPVAERCIREIMETLGKMGI